ncbi:MAG: 1,6-anhydro-N-acetylmuramyl-L-alanine amidase AmpD [Gammaproteobacteria bacterium]|nr:1,6-anhydro-N-acetylmuramyl-L-alanine amidase AmpD [Gammaproteobacteria bacterium]
MQPSATLTLNPLTGWLEGAKHLPSDNHNARPNAEISLLVIHNISLPPGEFGTGMVEALFTNQLPADAHPYFAGIAHLKVSAHFFIKRNGAITQFVSCLDRAWHAGVSNFAGRENCNDFSLGVELEGEDDRAYSDAQYQSLNQLIAELVKHYPLITPERICGHSDIAPQRKTDPGPAFNWQRLHAKYHGETS